MKELQAKLLAGLFLAMATASVATAGVCARTGTNVPVMSGVGEIDISGTNLPGSAIPQAIGYWQKCSQYGQGFPTMVPNGMGGLPANVVFHGGQSPTSTGRCGRMTMSYAGNTVVSATVDLYARQSNGSPCQPVADNLAQELGHVLGEGDAPVGGCQGHIYGSPGHGRRHALHVCRRLQHGGLEVEDS